LFETALKKGIRDLHGITSNQLRKIQEMGFRLQKRVGGNKGLGINISGSGLSTSYRSKYGAISSKGFSIRTGIPGLTFRSNWAKGNRKGNGASVLALIMLTLFLSYLAIVVIYNVFRFLVWVITEIYHLVLRLYYRWKEKQAQKLEIESPDSKQELPSP
jgi:hypothetical protein